MRVIDGPFEWPIADAEVLAAMEAAHRDGSWGQYHGPHGEGFSDDLRRKFLCENVLLCSSGTIGVELALRGCGVEPGDEVVLAAYDFSGNFRAIEAIGARPVLVDVNADSWCMDSDSLEAVTRERVKAVIVSHLHGGLADMSRIRTITRQRGWSVIEDACQQPGARIGGKPVGGLGDVGVLSFGGSKLLTAGRGGAVLSHDARIHQRMKVYAERGNWAFPLSELQAAVLRPQLAKLDERNRRRAERVAVLRDACQDLSALLRPVANRHETEPAFYKFAWSLVAAENDAASREELLNRLQAAGAPIDVGFRGFAKRSVRRCERAGSLGTSEKLCQSTMLLHHPILLAHEKAALQVAELLNHHVRKL